MDLTPPEPDSTPDPFAGASDADLEAELLTATSNGTAGRLAQARVTAIRTVLRVRAARRRAVAFSEDHQAALELVNAHRGPDEQLTSIDPTWVAGIAEDPEWAPLYASDEEIRERSNG